MHLQKEFFSKLQKLLKFYLRSTILTKFEYKNSFSNIIYQKV